MNFTDMLSTAKLWMADILHLVSGDLLVPTMCLLAAFIAYSLWCIGSILVEVITERRHLKAKIPQLIDTLDASSVADFAGIIDTSGLLLRQKKALTELTHHTQLPEDSLVALAKRLIADEEVHYQKIVARTDIATKVAPMLGLMGTLIPLGPGIVAMGQGDTQTLASSLLIAFDTTVAGLSTAIVTFAVSKLRKRWYEDYMVSIESVMTCMLQKILAMSDAERAAARRHSVPEQRTQPEQRVHARRDVEGATAAHAAVVSRAGE